MTGPPLSGPVFHHHHHLSDPSSARLDLAANDYTWSDMGMVRRSIECPAGQRPLKAERVDDGSERYRIQKTLSKLDGNFFDHNMSNTRYSFLGNGCSEKLIDCSQETESHRGDRRLLEVDPCEIASLLPKALKVSRKQHSGVSLEEMAESSADKAHGTPRLVVTDPRSESEPINDSGNTGDASGSDGDEIEIAISDEDREPIDEEEVPAPKTAAERLAEKRRMKRFSQTRFLLNEFAVRPNPDAAHRERLSQKIEGLSPRQVQVWFQNRRAKLKRVTEEEQKKVTKTRGQSRGSAPSLSSASGIRRPSLPLNPHNALSNTPHIDASKVLRSSSISLSAAGDSSNTSPVSSIHEGWAYSNAQSPITTSQHLDSPFLRAASSTPNSFNAGTEFATPYRAPQMGHGLPSHFNMASASPLLDDHALDYGAAGDAYLAGQGQSSSTMNPHPPTQWTNIAEPNRNALLTDPHFIAQDLQSELTSGGQLPSGLRQEENAALGYMPSEPGSVPWQIDWTGQFPPETQPTVNFSSQPTNEPPTQPPEPNAQGTLEFSVMDPQGQHDFSYLGYPQQQNIVPPQPYHYGYSAQSDEISQPVAQRMTGLGISSMSALSREPSPGLGPEYDTTDPSSSTLRPRRRDRTGR